MLGAVVGGYTYKFLLGDYLPPAHVNAEGRRPTIGVADYGRPSVRILPSIPSVPEFEDFDPSEPYVPGSVWPPPATPKVSFLGVDGEDKPKISKRWTFHTPKKISFKVPEKPQVEKRTHAESSASSSFP
jgi:hypothetical protein